MKKLWIDANGIYRAEFEGEEAIVGWFLEQDIQSSQKGCQIYIAALEAVQRGEVKEWKGTGNAFTVSAKEEITTISSDFADDRLRLPILQVIEHLKDWQNHIAEP